jgi:hypothetical protein
MKTTAELRRELREAEQRDVDNREAARKATPVKYQYTIEPAKRESTFDKIYDDTCCMYEIRRTAVNLEAAVAAGHEEWELRDGRMRYLFNSWGGKIVTAVGGGTVYIGRVWNGPEDYADDRAFEQINVFLGEHPEGGDITTIVDEFLAIRKLNQ